MLSLELMSAVDRLACWIWGRYLDATLWYPFCCHSYKHNESIAHTCSVMMHRGLTVAGSYREGGTGRKGWEASFRWIGNVSLIKQYDVEANVKIFYLIDVPMSIILYSVSSECFKYFQSSHIGGWQNDTPKVAKKWYKILQNFSIFNLKSKSSGCVVMAVFKE